MRNDPEYLGARRRSPNESLGREPNTQPGWERFAIFVLGAGFSRLAGLPLATELWTEVRTRAERMTGRAGKFLNDLDAYIEFRRDCDRVSLAPEDVDFEEFLGFLDVEHYLGLRGSDTWSMADGNETQMLVKTLIGQILAERTPPGDQLPDVYLDFARQLWPGDYVLTFNYDLLLERALEAVGRPYRLFPQRFSSINGSYGLIDDSKEEVVLLKLHGSIDWFDRAGYRERIEAAMAMGAGLPRDRVFGEGSNLNVNPLADGPRFADDPLNEMCRVTPIERFYRDPPLFLNTPWLLNPSSAKLLYARTLKDFLWGFGAAGSLNFGLAIIGFSLPAHDDYARQVLYRLVTNYQRHYWDREIGGLRKGPLVLVNRCSSAADAKALQQRYRFVDWSRAETHFDGFDERAMDLIRKTI